MLGRTGKGLLGIGNSVCKCTDMEGKDPSLPRFSGSKPFMGAQGHVRLCTAVTFGSGMMEGLL